MIRELQVKNRKSDYLENVKSLNGELYPADLAMCMLDTIKCLADMDRIKQPSCQMKLIRKGPPEIYTANWWCASSFGLHPWSGGMSFIRELTNAIEKVSLLKKRREEEEHHIIYEYSTLIYYIIEFMQELVMASTWEKTKEFYNWVLESGDPRTDSWFLVHSPLPVTFLFASYLFVVALGPFYMCHRKPLKLRGLLIAYNLAMMTLSSYMFYEVRRQDWSLGLAGEATVSENKNRFSRLMQSSPRVPSTLQLPAAESIDVTVYCLFSMHKPFQNRSLSLVYFLVTSVLANYSYLCQPVDYSRSELGMRQMARVCWWFFFSKVIELLDTVFFILRKKQEQVTFLHVYHHGTMLFNWWSGVKYVPGGQAFFIGMLNSFVHIFMYGYYALASLGPQMHRYLWWKRYLTIMQLCQFVAIAVHSSYNLFAECPFPDGFNIAVFLYILSLIALFLHFYYWTYTRGKKEKLT
ncbi:elongation of very long chain fatty acids protein 4 [Columba livia]|nr:elongation of very long chain fatty acids protein 4 [Columba livia]